MLAPACLAYARALRRARHRCAQALAGGGTAPLEGLVFRDYGVGVTVVTAEVGGMLVGVFGIGVGVLGAEVGAGVFVGGGE